MRLVFLAGAWLVTALAAHAQPCHDEQRSEVAVPALASVAAHTLAAVRVDGCCGVWRADCLCCEVQPAPLVPARERAQAPATALRPADRPGARPLRAAWATGATSERGPPLVGAVEAQGPRGPPAARRA